MNHILKQTSLSKRITSQNVNVISEGYITEKDILMKDGRFEKIANDIEPQ